MDGTFSTSSLPNGDSNVQNCVYSCTHTTYTNL